MELKPDKRHLAGGLAGAALMAAFLAYFGAGDPGPVYYKPAADAHAGDVYNDIRCADCHVPFQKNTDSKCLDCHDHAAIRTALALPAEKAVRPLVTASQRLHVLVAGSSCSECHLEHKPSELTNLLKLPHAERPGKPGFYAAVHNTLPPGMRDPQRCLDCHVEAEIKAPGSVPVASAPPAAPPPPAASPASTPPANAAAPAAAEEDSATTPPAGSAPAAAPEPSPKPSAKPKTSKSSSKSKKNSGKSGRNSKTSR